MWMWCGLLVAALAVGCGADDDGDDTGSVGDGGASDGGTGDGGAGDGGTAGTDIASRLTRTGGCSDLVVWATSDDETWALWVVEDGGMVQAAHDAGATISSTWDMGMDLTDAPDVTVLQGSNLGVLFCNDVAETYTIDHQWTMVDGTLTIEVTPTGDATKWGEMPADATLTVTDGVFSASGIEDVLISSFETTVAVGWLPG
ncbi:MAG: hypothetical protein D6798_16120 [Deltaproteobacteria bacterium]|nr:MAG: hypothetical protein D6798_16120 [Deltaproteobacteria bacterium]